MNKDLKYYLKLDYPLITRKYSDKGKQRYLVEYPDLPGCSSYGETPSKAYGMAEKAKKLWLETCIKESIQIPEPRTIEEYSGRFVLRPSKSIHYELSNLAKKENTSLNQCTLNLVAKGLGKQEVESEYKKEIQDLKSMLGIIESRLASLESKDRPLGMLETLDTTTAVMPSYYTCLSEEMFAAAWQQSPRRLMRKCLEKTPDTSSLTNDAEKKIKEIKEVTTT